MLVLCETNEQNAEAMITILFIDTIYTNKMQRMNAGRENPERLYT